MNRFGYLRDRLFVASLAAYACNRLLIRPNMDGLFHTHLPWAWPFLHSHFDDLLLMPAALPVAMRGFMMLSRRCWKGQGSMPYRNSGMDFGN